MMNHKLAWTVCASLCVALTACVDNDYDLSNVDTTVKIPVNDLTLPVNIEPVQLENIFNIDPNDPDATIKVVNGEYAVSQSGKFESEQVKVDPIILEAPVIESSINRISLTPEYAARTATATIPSKFSFEVSSEARDLNFESEFVSTYIDAVDNVVCDLKLTLDVKLSELEPLVRRINYTDLNVQLPKGLENVSADNSTNTSYNKETGVLTISSINSNGADMTLVINAKRIDVAFLIAKGEASFTPAEDGGKGHIAIHGGFHLISGKANINSSDLTTSNLASMPTHATMIVDYRLNDTEVTHFSGMVNYTIDPVDIPDVELNDLPDVLAQESTDLSLENPQIYLVITNPLEEYNLKAESQLSLTPVRKGVAAEPFYLDEPLVLESAQSVNGEFRFMLSPKNLPANERMEGFENAKWLRFSDLGKVLAGEGLPNVIRFDLVDPHVPSQPVTDFRLGRDLGTINGDYDLLAPLGMSEGSSIVYTDVVDGWASEDLDYCTIEKLTINLTISTDIPVDVKLTGYPVNTDGERIYDAAGKPIDIDGAIIPANAKNHQVTVHTTGVIPPNSKLNGIKFVATGVADQPAPGESNPALSPDMTITMSNIRASVTGFYMKDLDD